MADVLTNIGAIGLGIFDTILHYSLGFAILAVVSLFLYLYFIKPKPIDERKELFDDYWEATTERLGLHAPKKLAIISVPFTAEEANENIHQLRHELIGDIVGINIAGVMTDEKTLYEMTNNLDSKTYKKMVEENKEEIDYNRFWFILACKRRTKGIILPKVKKTLIWVKSNQIININSSDDIIRVRGFGLIPQGYNEIIDDENINITRKQLLSDTVKMIDENVILKVYGHHSETIELAMRSDSNFRKEVSFEGVKALVPNNDEKESEQ